MMADFLRNGRFIALSLALLIVAGLSASFTLPVTEDPRIKNRAAIILTQFPGASAERVEALVSEPIENELRRLPEIKDIISTSKPDLSAVRIILKDDVYDTEPVWSRARNYLSDIQPQLPPGAAQSQFFDDRGYAFTLLFSLTWSGENGDSATSQAILKRWADELQSRMRNLSGTDHVRIFGDPTEEILVEVDSRRAAAMQLSFQQISAAIGRADAKVASGNISNDFSRMQVEVSGELDSEQRIRSIPVRLGSDGEDTPLGSIASISRQTQDPPDEIAELGGRRGIVVGVRMLPNIRIDRWQQDAMAIMQDFRRSLSSNVEVEVIFDQAIYTSDRLGGLWVNVAVGFSLVVLVLLVTLGIRAALIVAMALPLTAAFTLAVMKAIGLPIHQMSVTGLVVALGIMVDNAIVMVDLIQQKRMRGKRALTAMMESIRHLWMPLAGSTPDHGTGIRTDRADARASWRICRWHCALRHGIADRFLHHFTHPDRRHGGSPAEALQYRQGHAHQRFASAGCV